MPDISSLIEALMTGKGVSAASVLTLVAAMIIGGIISGYVKEIWFYLFPFPNQKSRILALQKALIDETRRADENRVIAEAAIFKLNTRRWKELTGEDQADSTEIDECDSNEDNTPKTDLVIMGRRNEGLEVRPTKQNP